MTGTARDRAATAHRGEEARAWAGRGAIRAQGRLPQGGNHGRDETPSTRGGREAAHRVRQEPSGWSRGKLGVALLVGLVVTGLLVALGTMWRTPTPGPGAITTGTVLVVWHMPGQESARISAVDRNQWQDFVASRQAERLKARQAILETARTEMTEAVAPLFDDMKGRIKDYTGWFYFFPTTYRLAFTAVIAALSRDPNDTRSPVEVASQAITQLLRDRYVEVVVMPEHFGPAVDGKARDVLHHAIANELAAAETENRSLAAFLADHGRPADGDRAAAGERSLPVVLSWEALGLPADAASMAAPPDAVQLLKSDPSLNDLQSTAGTEGGMLVGRQIARRVVQVAVNNATDALVIPMMAGAPLGPASVVVSPLLGITAFGLGIGAEYGTIKLRQVVEGPQLTETSNVVLEHLRENQSRVLADAVAKRIEDWLGG